MNLRFYLYLCHILCFDFVYIPRNTLDIINVITKSLYITLYHEKNNTFYFNTCNIICFY